MASTTGIEIGPDSFLFAGVRRIHGQRAEIFSVRRFEVSERSADPGLVADALRTIRRDHRLPRRAAVVVWNGTDGIDGTGPREPLESLTRAGFQIVSVMSPPQALAAVATTVRRGGGADDAIAWLALNSSGASIAIVRGRELLFARTFAWTYKADLPTSNAQLLQRYLLVSHLAPELEHGFKTVRHVHGAEVDLIVTCGNLPELRSMTLPLIEELDVEVETLDSSEGLAIARRMQAEDFTALAPAVRLATAAAAGIATLGDSRLIGASRLAAAAAAIAAVAWVGYSYWHGSPRPAVRQESIPQPPPASSRADSTRSITAQSPSEPAPPLISTPQPVATRGSDEPNRATSRAQDTGLRTLPAQSRPVPSDTRKAAPPDTSSPAAPLDEPLPRIDTVLIDQDRRLAILDGAVVGVGDPIGSRVVVAIAREAILLREPSGRIVRVRPRVGM